MLGKVFQSAQQQSSTVEERGTKYRFGGKFWVVVVSSGRIHGVPVETGITDLDQAEIVSGLAEGDEVMMLPSTHLVETQIELQGWMRRRVGGVPGISTSR